MMCALLTVLFCGGWHPGVIPTSVIESWPEWLSTVVYLLTFYLKVWLWFCAFALVKAFVPRYRYDQLMRLGWKIFLPTSLVAVVLAAAWQVFGVNG
jgi:NADH-quinone oxidoreductase subunit H